jgi:hypothetical protein
LQLDMILPSPLRNFTINFRETLEWNKYTSILGHVQRPPTSRLRANLFAKSTSPQPGDGRVVASRENGYVPCSEAGSDAAAPLYESITASVHPPRRQQLIWVRSTSPPHRDLPGTTGTQAPIAAAVPEPAREEQWEGHP